MNSHTLVTFTVLLLLAVLVCLMIGLLVPEPPEEPTGLVPATLNTLEEYYDTHMHMQTPIPR